jgi:hypothetical protein
VVRAWRHVGRRPADTRLIVSAPVLTVTEVRSGTAVPFRTHNKDRRRHAAAANEHRPIQPFIQLSRLYDSGIGVERREPAGKTRADSAAYQATNNGSDGLRPLK